MRRCGKTNPNKTRPISQFRTISYQSPEDQSDHFQQFPLIDSNQATANCYLDRMITMIMILNFIASVYLHPNRAICSVFDNKTLDLNQTYLKNKVAVVVFMNQTDHLFIFIQ